MAGTPNPTNGTPLPPSQLSPVLHSPVDEAPRPRPGIEEPVSAQSPPPTSNPGLAGVLSHPSEAGPNNKLSKWLSRNRSRSVGAQEALGTPSISISASASVQSNLVVGNAELDPQDTSTRPSTSSLPMESPPDGHRTKSGSGGFSSLSLRPNRKGNRPVGDEVLDEWASAEVDDEDAARSEENGRGLVPVGGEGKSSKTARFTTKRKKSNLKLFNRAESATAAEEVVPNPSHDHPELPYGPSSNAKSRSSTSLLETRSSTSIRQPTVTRPASFSQLNQAQNATNNVAGRIGGWFSSMLHSTNGAPGVKSPSSTHLPLPDPAHEPHSSSYSTTPPNSSFFQPNNVSPRSANPPSVSSPQSKTQRASPFLSSSTPPSQAATGLGRLGPLDRMLDKAVQYFLDTDSTADKCEEDIWVLGVGHAGYSPPPPPGPGLSPVDEAGERTGDRQSLHRKKKSLSISLGKRKEKRRESTDDYHSGERRPSSPIPPLPNATLGDYEHVGTTPSSAASSIRASPKVSPQPSFQISPTTISPPFQFPPSSTVNNASSTTLSMPSANSRTQGWPSTFYLDFYSRMALTYRTGFLPIPCSPASGSGGMHGMFNSLSLSIGRGGSSGARTAEGLSSDTGWGCMLRTGQSLLANTLMTVHLGRGGFSDSGACNPSPKI